VQLPIFREAFVSKSEFISLWSRQYSYENEHLYDDNIGKELIEDRIWALFQWKNGGPLSKKKQVSVKENFINEKVEIPHNLDNFDLLTYLNKPGGAIWRIFWLHCNRPNIYPIYDQHVHRSMAKLNALNPIEIPPQNKVKVEMYINRYLPFWTEFLEFSSKKVDEALWSYGKFLKLKYDFTCK
jgi:hypothetical protein